MDDKKSKSRIPDDQHELSRMSRGCREVKTIDNEFAMFGIMRERTGTCKRGQQ